MNLAQIAQQAMSRSAPSGDAFDQITSQGRAGASVAGGWQQYDLGNNQLYEVNPATREVRKGKLWVDTTQSAADGGMGGPDTGYDAWGLAPSKPTFVDKAAGLLPYIGGIVATMGGAGLLAGGAGAAAGAVMPPAVIDAAGIAGMSTTGAAAAGGAATLMPPAVAESGATLSQLPSAAPAASGFSGDFDAGSFEGLNEMSFTSPSELGFEGAGSRVIDTSGFGSSFDAGGMPQGYMPGENSLEEMWKKFKMLKGGPMGNALSIGSGVLGLYRANQMSKMSKAAMERSDPFGPERAGYAAKLRELYADPSQVQKLPGYKAGLQAVERKMASQGYLGSGNMMVALHDYGGRAFDAEAARLSTLAGAGMQPDTRAGLQGQGMSDDLLARSLASIAFGARGF